MESKQKKSKNDKAKPLREKKITVTFVCTGNTCRSPVAEKLFRAHLKNEKKASKYRVLSAGVAARNGSPMSTHSQTVLKNALIPNSSHKAKVVDQKLVKMTDYFICLTEGHKNALKGLPKKILTIGEIASCGDVIDPYGGDEAAYQKMFEHLQYAMQEILDYIEKDAL